MFPVLRYRSVSAEMTIEPSSLDELRDSLADAGARGEKVSHVNLRALDRVVEHAPQDMTVTVEAGITLARLQSELARQRQWLPIDPPRADTLTIEAALATDASGPRRFGCGTIRDYLIGSKVVVADGRVIKSGGKVVKNVTGYDLTRLWSGTFGTLVAIVEVTLKLTAIPERTVSLVADADVPEAFETAKLLHASGLPLDALAIVTGEAASGLGARGDTALLVRLTGPAAAVRRLGREVRELVRWRDVANEVWNDIGALPLEAKWAARVAWPRHWRRTAS